MSSAPISDSATTPSAIEGAVAGVAVLPVPDVHAPQRVEARVAGQPTTLSWLADGPHSGKGVTVGIEYDGSRLVVVALKRTGRQSSLQGFITADFEQAPTVAQISQLLRDFVPARGTHVQLAVTSSRAVMRRFSLPALAKAQRLAAATWQGQKVVPFQLREKEALYGFSFLPGPNKSWQVTLVALPRADASPVLEAIEAIGWTLQSISISGTCILDTVGEAPPDTSRIRAVVLWSLRRGAFVAYEGDQLQFHYDLGPLPDLPLKTAATDEDKSQMASDWLKEMGRAIGDALEFYLGAYPQSPAQRLELMGVPEAVAPLVTQWQERFGLSVVVVDPVQRFTRQVPDRIRAWIAAYPSLLTAAVLAAAGRATVDLTPPTLAVTRQRRSYARIARGAFILSSAVVVAWMVLLLMQANVADRTVATAKQELNALQKSAAGVEMSRAVAQLQQTRALNACISAAPQRWMPWAKALTATFPMGTQLASLGLDAPPGANAATTRPAAHLEGRIAPSARPHSLVYADWIRDLDRIAGHGAARLLSTRTVEWKGRRSSEFVLQIDPSRSSGTEGR